MNEGPVALVVAKAPVPGEVKTRLAAQVGDLAAAELAAAALLDTLDACEEAFTRCHIALAGSLTSAVLGSDIERRLARWVVHEQPEGSLGQRLAQAHRDAFAGAVAAVVQVGMDTPQLTATALRGVARLVEGGLHDAVLGPAVDGGWWVLALTDPKHATVLPGVRMSLPTTHEETHRALVAAGARVAPAPELADVDTVQDAAAVAAAAPGTRFATTWARMP